MRRITVSQLEPPSEGVFIIREELVEDMWVPVYYACASYIGATQHELLNRAALPDWPDTYKSLMFINFHILAVVV